MKKLLAATFVALLMVGCGEDTKKPVGDSPESNQTSAETPPAKSPEVGGIDLDDLETLDKIIAEAFDGNKIQKRDKEGERLVYAPNKQTPYTGWSKMMYDNGRIRILSQFKDGKKDGLQREWYPNGQKEFEGNYKDGERNGLSTHWYENGQKKFKSSYKDGEKDGLTTHWYENGQMSYEGKHKDGKVDGFATMWYKSGQMRLERHLKGGKLISAIVWRPNGEKCPLTNVVNGNGVWVAYWENGRELARLTYKDGE